MFPGEPGDDHRYDDIIDLPRPVSAAHPPMPLASRAAQFAPFAALTGFDAAIQETARLTEARIELDETERAALNARLQLLQRRSAARPTVRITRFVPDPRKAGGRYEAVAGVVRRIVPAEGSLILEGGARIALEDIIAIEGEIFDGMEDQGG